MFKNYLKVALRNLQNSKIYSLINIAGLAIGLACFMLISNYIKYELSFDEFHENKDRIYRAYGTRNRPGLGVVHNAVTPGTLAPAMLQDLPQVERATRVRPLRTVFCKVGEKRFYENHIAMVDPDFFEIFSIEMKRGDVTTALAQPFTLILSEELAHKYFGETDPIGQTMTIEHSDGADDYTVAGVMANYPDNSHLRFDALGSFITLANRFSWINSWNTNSLGTYILLKEGAELDELTAQLPAFLEKHIGEENARNFQVSLQPLSEVHLRSGHLLYQTYNNQQGSINTVYMFSAIAVLVLLIACINFMNLSTARSAKRAKEVGIRKAVGSNRRQLIVQFLSESIVISFLALLVALFLMEIGQAAFESILGERLPVDALGAWSGSLELAALILVVGIISGSYPAFFLSAYQPTQTMKGDFSAGGKGAILRKNLVVVQFAIAMALIICTGIIMDQMNYVREKDLGFNKEQVVYVPVRGKEARAKIPALKNELRRHANVRNAAACVSPRGASGSNGLVTVAGTNGEMQLMMRFSYVDFDYLDTMEMQIVQGRKFSPSFAQDTVTSVIINETAARKLGWENAIGKQFEQGNGPNLSVIGVVTDFHFFGLHDNIEPLIMGIGPSQFRYLLIKVAPHDLSATLSFIENVWRQHVPEQPFEYDFVDEYFARLYTKDENTGRLFSGFAMLAVFVACIGLLGLASFTTEQKTKEIGVRKVLGASAGGIVVLLSKQFIKWVALASFIAMPVAYLAMQSWLADFAYRTAIHWQTFVLAAILVVAVALVTVSAQATRAAMLNPARALRYE